MKVILHPGPLKTPGSRFVSSVTLAKKYGVKFSDEVIIYNYENPLHREWAYSQEYVNLFPRQDEEYFNIHDNDQITKT